MYRRLASPLSTTCSERRRICFAAGSRSAEGLPRPKEEHLHRLNQRHVSISAFVRHKNTAGVVLGAENIVLTRAAFTGIEKPKLAVKGAALNRDPQRGGLCRDSQARHRCHTNQRCRRPPLQTSQCHILFATVSVCTSKLSLARSSKMSAGFVVLC